MKYSELRKKFSNKLNFVKPLYNRVRFRNRVQPKSIIINIERKLHGRGFYVNREFSGNENVHANRIHLNSWKGKCVSRKFSGNGVRDFKRNYDVWNNQTMLSIKEDKENRMYKGNKFNEGERDAQDKPVVCHKALMTWLQVYPAPSLPNEGVVSIVFRCVMCQLGLAAFLVTWTVIWLLMISYFEEPHELKIAHDFTKEQNQLVINLATELRQITPISPKWREMIETRIEDERKLTVQAVGKGAKLHPGQYWDLSGTFLFTVFVMTALGFGAPVPQTAWGRTCTVVYAAFAVPGHIFFMVNISTCITFHVERIIKTRRLKRTNDIKQDVQSSSRNSDEHVFDSLTNFGLRRNISKILRMFVVARGLPLTILTYYMIGAISFGYLRGLPAFETIMFPLEFTTSGGLEMVRSHVRILYAFYVEGAVFILACTIATLKFHSRNSIEDMIEKHRLFSMEPCDECEERNIKYPPSHQVK